MANEAETLEEIETPETEVTLDKEVSEEGSTDETTEEDQQAEDNGVEVVLEGEGSQPEKVERPGKELRIKKRINKLNAKVESANAEAEETRKLLEQKEKENELLRMALEQKKESPRQLLEPSPDDFDGGYLDPDFVKKQNEFNRLKIKQEITKDLADSNKQSSEAVNRDTQFRNLEQKQSQHYERVNGLGAKDYDETEDKAIEIMGNDIVNGIIAESESSHVLLYYLGKNPAKAEQLADLLKSNPLRGVLNIGRLEAELKVKPKTNKTPDPDEELKGSGAMSPGKRGLKGATFT